MRFCVALLVALAASGWLSPVPTGAQSNAAATTSWSREAEMVRGWYSDYLGRNVGPELTAWVQLLRGGMAPVDVQATILGSDEYYQQQRRDPERFILDTLEGVTWEAPDQATVDRWTNRLDQLRGDRVALAREILLTYNQPQQQTPTTGTALDQATRLTAAAKLLADNADFELSGTVQGQQVSLRARALSAACVQLQQQMKLRSAQPAQVNSSFAAVVRAFEATQQALANPPGTAPSSSAVARRVGSLIVELEDSLRTSASPPPATKPHYQTYDQRQLLAQVESVARAVQSVMQVLAPAANQDYRYRVALRDLDGLASRVDAFADLTKRGASREQLDYDAQTLRAMADRIRPQLFDGEPPLFTRLYWLSVEAGLEQMRDTLKANGSASGSTGGPITTTRPNSALIGLTDQAVAQVDAFLTGISPLVFGVPEIPGQQRAVRNLRNRLLELRQMVVEGEPVTELTLTTRQAANDYQAAAARWDQIVGSYRLINPVRLSPVGTTIDEIYQTLTNVSPSTTQRVDPQTQYSQVQRLLAAFDEELAAFQTTLAPFQNYQQEYPQLTAYANQMAGYSRSITDLEKDPARNREQQRRYTAGMQRLIDLFDAYSARIEERAIATRVAEPRQKAGELRQSARRLAGLVNDLERQLH